MSEPVKRAQTKAQKRDRKRQTRMAVTGQSTKQLMQMLARPRRSAK